MYEARRPVFFFLIALIITSSTSAFGQWITQTIDLQPGWNAVFLAVEPSPNQCEAIFDGLSIESVWAWNKRFTSVQFIQDPDTLLPEQPEWLTYLPPGKPNAFSTNLFILRGGHSYLIHMGGSEPVSLQIKGKPVFRAVDWMSNSFNLTGFYIDPANPPAFKDFFAPSPAHTGQPIYRMTASGKWQAIPSSEVIQPGEAYWIYCRGQSKYSGPLVPIFEQAGEINFGRIVIERTISIKNESSLNKSISLNRQSSENPPQGVYPLLAGDVLLSYWNKDIVDWANFPDQSAFDIQPGQQLKLRVAVRRKDMPGDPDSVYQSLITVSDGQGTFLTLPVSAKGLIPYEGGLTAKKRMRDNQPYYKWAGLWVGMAVIDKVNCPSDLSNPNTPKPTATEFQFRLIIHVDGGKKARFLQQVYYMWQNGCEAPDPNDPTKNIITKPGEFVLITNDNLIPNFSGSTVIDGKQVGRRISTAVFTFPEPHPLTGPFGIRLSSGEFTLGYNHPLNPFKHKYHPDHDNLKQGNLRPADEESYDIKREITLLFTAEDPEDLKIPGWGDDQLGGIYKEKFIGIHKNEIYVEGIFRLQHVSHIPGLNPDPFDCEEINAGN